MNIIGENFPEFVKTQVEQRELVYGKQERDNQDLTYLNSNTPWIKLGSSVDIDQNSQKYIDLEIPEGFGGEELAKSAVLFNGTSNKDTQFEGISRNNSILNNSAYGFGGNEFGLSPMPGITSVTTKFLNRGSVKEATINLVAHNPKQFAIIEYLYLRLGYHLLLEFGNSLYLDNETSEVESSRDTLMNKFISKGFKKNDIYGILEEIAQTRERYFGNYEGFIGRVKNFSWEFRSDGGYDITISMISMGDVIESLKFNSYSGILPEISDSKNASDPPKSEDISDTSKLIETYKNSSTIASLLYDAIEYLKGNNPQNAFIQTFTNRKTKSIEYCTQDYIGNSDNFFYIRLGKFLELIQDNLLFYDSSENPCIKFDTDIETNLMFVDYYNTKKASFTTFSSRPDICNIPSEFEFEGKKRAFFPDVTRAILKPGREVNSFTTTLSGVLVGKIMNIFLEMGFLVRLINELKDEDGNVGLFSFLQKMLDNINSSLGSKNKLQPVLREETNEVVIIDETPLPEKIKVINSISSGSQPTEFNIFAYNGNRSGFVKEFNFKTELSKNTSTSIAIGAQAGGTAVGENSTAFSSWNKGLTDRYFTEKNSTSTKDLSNLSDPNPNEGLTQEELDDLSSFDERGPANFSQGASTTDPQLSQKNTKEEISVIDSKIANSKKIVKKYRDTLDNFLLKISSPL